MSDLAKARKALDDALAELADAARAAAERGGAPDGGGDGGGQALSEVEAERDELAQRLVEMQAERAKDAAMIEDALADLRKIA